MGNRIPLPRSPAQLFISSPILLSSGASLFGLRHFNRQNAVFEAGPDPVGLDRVGQLHCRQQQPQLLSDTMYRLLSSSSVLSSFFSPEIVSPFFPTVTLMSFSLIPGMSAFTRMAFSSSDTSILGYLALL